MWHNDLAKEFKKRNNKSGLGALVGTIININPFRISLLSGQLIISKNIYLADNIILEELNLNVDYSLNSVGVIGPVNTSGTIKLKDKLNKDDKVMVVVSEDNHSFFIISKIRKVV